MSVKYESVVPSCPVFIFSVVFLSLKCMSMYEDLCLGVCAHKCSACGSHKRASDALQLKLQSEVSCLMWVLGSQLQAPGERANLLTVKHLPLVYLLLLKVTFLCSSHLMQCVSWGFRKAAGFSNSKASFFKNGFWGQSFVKLQHFKDISIFNTKKQLLSAYDLVCFPI